MIENKKGFSLIELLVVIAIIGVILLISFPMVDNLIKKNGRTKYDAYRNVIEEAAKEYMDDLGFIVSGCYEIKTEEQSSYEVLESEGLLSNFNEDCKDTKVYVLSDEKGNIIDYKVNLVCGRENVLDKEYTSNTCDYEIVQYKDAYGGNADVSFANEPQLADEMIPVKYNGENWIVADKNNVKFSNVFEESYVWYDYNNGKLANAVFVKKEKYNKYTYSSGLNRFTNGTVLDEEDVTSWWIWIPRYAYSNSKPWQEIKYIKETGNAEYGYTLSPGFTTTNQLGKKQLKGFWVGKQNFNLSEDKTIQDYYMYGTNFLSSYNSHVINYNEMVTAYRLNKIYENIDATNNTLMENVTDEQLISSTFSQDDIPTLDLDFSATYIDSGHTIDDCTNGYCSPTCTKGGANCCNTSCTQKIGICYYTTKYTYGSCKDICITNFCRTKCYASSALTVNNKIGVSIRQIEKKATYQKDYEKYLDVIHKDILENASKALSCSDNTTLNVEQNFNIDGSTSFVFINNGNTTSGKTISYTITIDKKTTESFLKKQLTGGKIVPDRFNNFIKGNPVNITPTITNTISVPSSRLALYYENF